VMFCVLAAPTPARTFAQRAATAGLDEVIAIPTRPDRGHQPTIERVMSRLHAQPE
jgi:hypothetical protein